MERSDTGSFIKQRGKNVKLNVDPSVPQTSNGSTSPVEPDTSPILSPDKNKIQIDNDGEYNDKHRSERCCGRRCITCSDVMTYILSIRRADILSGFMNGFIMFVFSSTYSFLIFDETGLEQAVPVGVSIHTITAFVSAIAFAIFSTIPMTIAGPDTQTAVFAASMATIVRDAVVFSPKSMADPQTTQLLRETQYDSNSNNYNEAQQAILNNVTLEAYPEILPSILVSFMISTAIVSFLFLFLGVFRLTRIIQFLPSAVLSGFLAAIGYIVLVKGLQVATGDAWTKPLTPDFWEKLAPAIALGLFLHLMKRMKTMKLGALFLVSIVLPNAMFYAIVYGVNSNVDQARDEGWMFEFTQSVPFYEQWVYTFGSTAKVNWAAVGETVPIMFIMVFVVCVDFMLKLVSSKKMVQAHSISFEREMILAGKVNTFLVFCVGQPGYTQHRFNLINQEIAGDNDSSTSGSQPLSRSDKSIVRRENSGDDDEIEIDRPSSSGKIKQNQKGRLDKQKNNNKSKSQGGKEDEKKVRTTAVAGVICGLFNGVLFFTQFQLINYIPRFMIGGLLIFSALGLLIEHLWDTRHHLSRLEFLTVWIIFIVEALDTLLLAIFVGIVLAALGFAVQYAQTGVIRAIISGSDYQSSVIRSAQEDRKLEHLGSQCLVVVLSRFIFFGSASQVLDVIRDIIRNEYMNGGCGRVRYVIFDWEHVHGIDYTASNVFLELVQQLRSGFQLESTEVAENSTGGVDANKKVPRNHPTTASNFDAKNDITVVFTGMTSRVRQVLESEGVIQLLYENAEDAEIEYLNALRTQSANEASNSDRDNTNSKKPINRINNWFMGMHERKRPNGLSTNDKQELETKFLSFSQRRCFESLDLGVEWVEERLLESASIIRKRWLYFESFRRLHEQARLKAEHEAFEHVLGGHLGNMLWKYVTPLDVPQGWTLCRTGHVNPHLYLLQRGRLTVYLESSDKKRIVRLQSLRRGAFVNADALFVDTPVSHTIIADVDCKVLALSREKLKALEAQNPEVAFEIHRNVLRHTARTRDKLARELDALDSWIHLSDVNGKNGVYSSSRRLGGNKTITRSRAMRSTTLNNAFTGQGVNVWSLFSNGESTKEKFTNAMKIALSGKLVNPGFDYLAESSAEHYKFVNTKDQPQSSVALSKNIQTSSAATNEKRIKFGGDVVSNSKESKLANTASSNNGNNDDIEKGSQNKDDSASTSTPASFINIVNRNDDSSSPSKNYGRNDSMDSQVMELPISGASPEPEESKESSDVEQDRSTNGDSNVVIQTTLNEAKELDPPKSSVETKITGISSTNTTGREEILKDHTNILRGTTPRVNLMRQTSVDVAADIGPSDFPIAGNQNGQVSSSSSSSSAAATPQISNGSIANKKLPEEFEVFKSLDSNELDSIQRDKDGTPTNFHVPTSISSSSLGSKKIKSTGNTNDQEENSITNQGMIERPPSALSQTQESVATGNSEQSNFVKKSDVMKEDFISPPPLRNEPKMFKRLLHPESGGLPPTGKPPLPNSDDSNTSSQSSYNRSTRILKKSSVEDSPSNPSPFIGIDAGTTISHIRAANSSGSLSSYVHPPPSVGAESSSSSGRDSAFLGRSSSDGSSSSKMPMHPGVSSTLAQSIISKSPPLRGRLNSTSSLSKIPVISSSLHIEGSKLGNVQSSSGGSRSSGLSSQTFDNQPPPIQLSAQATKPQSEMPELEQKPQQQLLNIMYKPKLSESKKMDAIGCFSRAVEAHRHLLLGREENELEAEYNRLNANLLPRNVLLQSLMDLGLFPTEMELEKLLQRIRSKERLKKRSSSKSKSRMSFSSSHSNKSSESRFSIDDKDDTNTYEGGTYTKREPRGSFQDVGGFITIDLGHLFDEANRPISEKEFLKLVTTLSLAELDQDQLSKFAAVFMEYSVDIHFISSPQLFAEIEAARSDIMRIKSKTSKEHSNIAPRKKSRTVSAESSSRLHTRNEEQSASEEDDEGSDSNAENITGEQLHHHHNETGTDPSLLSSNKVPSTSSLDDDSQIYETRDDIGIQNSMSLQDRLSSRDNITMHDLKQRVLTVDGLSKLMEDFGHPEDLVALHRLVAEWSTHTSNLKYRAVTFNSFCCMLANILKMEKLEDRVEADWAKFVGANGNIMTHLVSAEDILRVIPFITRQEAVEMIWEADIDETGGISLANFIDTITTVWDPEISQNYDAQQMQIHNQKTNTLNVDSKGASIHGVENRTVLHACAGLDEFQPISSLVKREKPTQLFPQFVPSSGILKKSAENSAMVSFDMLTNESPNRGSVLLAPSSRRRARTSSTSADPNRPQSQLPNENDFIQVQNIHTVDTVSFNQHKRAKSASSMVGIGGSSPGSSQPNNGASGVIVVEDQSLLIV